MVFCVLCGKELVGRPKFCTFCGGFQGPPGGGSGPPPPQHHQQHQQQQQQQQQQQHPHHPQGHMPHGAPPPHGGNPQYPGNAPRPPHQQQQQHPHVPAPTVVPRPATNSVGVVSAFENFQPPQPTAPPASHHHHQGTTQQPLSQPRGPHQPQPHNINSIKNPPPPMEPQTQAVSNAAPAPSAPPAAPVTLPPVPSQPPGGSGRRIVRVLSIDGGGIRGVIPATVLQRLEELTQRPISELFDLIAGTSTGGILALALTCPDPRDKSRPVYTATDALDVYLKRGAEIFSNSAPTANPSGAQGSESGGLAKIFSGAKILSGPKYNARNLERVLGEFLGSSLLRDSLTPLLITSYDLERRVPFFFKTRHALGQPDHNYEMRHVARATSAAPLYFPPAKLTDPHTGGHMGGYRALVDGGLIANNPSLLAFLEARELYPNADIVLVSLGTGQLANAIEYKEAKDWGIVGWGKSLLDCMMTGSSDVVDHQLQQVMLASTGGSRYYRFTVKLDGRSDDMDNVTPGNIQNLRRLAREQVVEARARELAACAAILTRPK